MSAEEIQSAPFDYLSAQIGVTSLLLGGIGLLFIIAAFPMFWFLKVRAETVAREAAEKLLAGAITRIENEAIKKVEAMLPALAREYIDLVETSVSDDVADDIAAAQGLEPNVNGGGDA